jgi:flagellar assembly factor FliW
VPKDVTKTTVNLKAPIIISVDNRRAVQLICEDDSLSIRYAIYDTLANQN